MMHCCETILFFTPLKKRELCYPYKTIFILVKQIHLFCKFQTECAKYIINQFLLICCKQKQVACLTIHSSYQSIHFFFCHEFCKRRFSGSVFSDRNVCKTFCTVSFGKLNQFVNFLTRHRALSFCIDTTDTSAVFQSRSKYTESTVLHYIAYIMQFHSETHIRFVRTESVHCFLPCDTLDRKFHINVKHFFEQICKESLIYINNIINVYERELHIDLCKLRLSVSTKVLITEASCDLNITVITGAHQKLFVKLW